MQDMSRRAALVGASAVAGSVVNLVAITASRPCELPPDDGPDAELIRLGGELRQLLWDDAEWTKRLEEASVGFYKIVDRYARSAGVPERQKDWDHHSHAAMYVACLGQAEKVSPEYYALQEKAEGAGDRLYDVLALIRDMPALTIAGLVVKATATEFATRNAKEDARPFEDQDWERQFILDLMQSVQMLAGGAVGRIRRKETREQDMAALRAAHA